MQLKNKTFETSANTYNDTKGWGALIIKSFEKAIKCVN